MPSQMQRHSSWRPKQKLTGCRARLKPLLVLPLRLPRSLAFFVERFHWRPQPLNLVLVRLVEHVLVGARFPNLSPNLKTGRNLTLPCSPSSRSLPEKLARAATLKTVPPLLPRRFPKPPPSPPGPAQTPPAQVADSLGPCSHGGGSQEGTGKRERQRRQ